MCVPNLNSIMMQKKCAFLLQLVVCMVIALSCMLTESDDKVNIGRRCGRSVQYKAINCRKHSALLTDFGAKGDGKTLNTRAFQAAIGKLSELSSDGGAQLIVPKGKWLTGSFNITACHFTLFLRKGAQIIASLVPLHCSCFCALGLSL